jgi:hypothetical protein
VLVEFIAVAVIALIVGVLAGMMISAWLVRRRQEGVDSGSDGAYLER